ncbi:ribosome-binding protein 1 [Coccinella septempunctata]|uniref:ribosome-binding protein 1 n=1 Tax=Coccinella septempunctata TaxID=41139 RepID=UPI001D090219|nr:ribosome-binding protein 1 [Coccinella septempunctata]XP_044746116.1 ribosome-binding protein 1 [Coccinella septempunctata]
MDLAILMFVAIIFVIASVILGLIYKFGMKEKSYEEALAEQKLSTQSLLGIKQKPKEKKNKKISKKAKDIDPDKMKKVPATQEGKGHAKTDKSRPEDSIQKQKDETKKKCAPDQSLPKNEDINSADTLISPQDSIKEKVILPKKVNSNSSNKPKANVNKKEQPKADSVKEKNVNAKKEFTKKESTGDQPKADSSKDKQVGDSVKLVKRELASKGQTEEHEILDKKEELLVKEVPKEEEHKVQNKPSKSNQLVQNPLEKETVEKVTNNSKPSLANGFVVNPPKDKKKKKDSYTLQQLAAGEPGLTFILNMIHNAELSHADIQFLINLLLNKQLDAPKVLEDWSEGKYDPVQKLKKQLAEKEKALIDEQETLAGVQIKLKEVRNEQLAERTSSNQKIKILEEQLQNLQMDLLACNNRCHAQGQQLQQTQAQLNEERMKLHSLREELAAVQMQRQQLEMHIAQESEVMIAQLRADIQEYSARNEQMLIDINTIQKVAADNEASYIAQLSNMTQELGEKSRQLEELHIELANKNEMLYRQEGELKTEIAQLNAVMQQQAEEIRKTEQSHDETMEEINNLKKQKSISNKVIAQLKGEIEKLQEYKTQQEASMENNKINETEVLNYKNELAYVKNLSEEKENNLKSEIDSKLSLISKLETELEEQKTKNNDLRNKNYKIMEALNAAEVRIKTIQEENSNKEKNSSDEKTSDIDSQKKFLSRLLPEVNGLEDISSEKWEEECSKLVTNYLETLKKNASNESTENLQARIEHYQNVIKNTEDMLAKLQVNIDQEQISWKAQIKNKDLELEALKEKLEKLQNIETINGSSFEGQ